MVPVTPFEKGNKHTQVIPRRSTDVLKDCRIGSVRNEWMNCGY